MIDQIIHFFRARVFLVIAILACGAGLIAGTIGSGILQACLIGALTAALLACAVLYRRHVTVVSLVSGLNEKIRQIESVSETAGVGLKTMVTELRGDALVRIEQLEQLASSRDMAIRSEIDRLTSTAGELNTALSLSGSRITEIEQTAGNKEQDLRNEIARLTSTTAELNRVLSLADVRM
ncbi:MAG: hypothetical protein ACRCWF_08275, partial [Beijerinckiaceae bacterium]